VAVVAGRGCAEDHRVAGADDDGSACLSGKLPGLEGDLIAPDLNRDAGNVEHAHFVLPFRPPGWRPPLASELSFSVARMVAAARPPHPARWRAASGDERPQRLDEIAAQAFSVHERRRRTRDTGTDAADEVALDAPPDRVRAAVGPEPVDVKPESRRALPQVRVVDVTSVGVERVAHLPGGALQAGGLGGGMEERRPLVLRGHREVPEAEAQRQL